MQFDEKEIQFIKDNKHLIEKNKYFFLYKKMRLHNFHCGKFTDFLIYECGIDVLKHTQGVVYDEMFARSEQTEIKIPEGITEIKSSAFFRCKADNIILPSTLEKIGEFAFSYCDNLKQITIPKHTKVAENAFQGTEVKIIKE